MMMTTAKRTIEIDCAPGVCAQESLMKSILDTKDYQPPVATFFGNWTWEFDHLPEAEWLKLSARAKEILTDAYHSGRIRYASW